MRSDANISRVSVSLQTEQPLEEQQLFLSVSDKKENYTKILTWEDRTLREISFYIHVKMKNEGGGKHKINPKIRHCLQFEFHREEELRTHFTGLRAANHKYETGKTVQKYHETYSTAQVLTDSHHFVTKQETLTTG